MIFLERNRKFNFNTVYLSVDVFVYFVNNDLVFRHQKEKNLPVLSRWSSTPSLTRLEGHLRDVTPRSLPFPRSDYEGRERPMGLKCQKVYLI